MRVVLEYFHPWPNSAGLHVAAERGWLPGTEISTYDPLIGDGLAHLREGRAEAAVVPVNRLLVQRALGLEARIVAAINHAAMETIQTVRSTGITRPAELAGKRVALNPTPRGLAMVRHVVAADGGDPDAVVIVDSGVREWPAQWLGPGGPADATFGGYWAWDVLLADLPADEHVVWRIGDLDAPQFQPYVLVVRDDVADADVRALLGGAARGWEQARADPAATLATLDRITPYFPRELLARSLELVTPTWFDAAGAWGRVDQEQLAGYARWLAAAGILSPADAARSDAAVRILVGAAPTDPAARTP